jgi:hypothetical protein
MDWVGVRKVRGSCSCTCTHVVGLALRADLAAESDGGALALDGLAVGVNVSHGDLDRGVVLGRDQAV